MRTLFVRRLYVIVGTQYIWYTVPCPGLEKLSKFCPNNFNVYQKQFSVYFNSEGKNVRENRKITIIDRAENVLKLRRRERERVREREREREREGERVIGNMSFVCLSLMG